MPRSHYVDSLFSLNIKCVLFGILLVSLVNDWFKIPKNNMLVSAVIFVGGYVLMSWYDHWYNCDERLKSGTSVIGLAMVDSIFKPDSIPDKEGGMSLEKGNKIRRRNIFVFHSLLVAPLLFYIGYFGKETPDQIWPVLIGLAALVLFYHGIQLFNHLR